jgi:hypothetical protein
MQRLRRFARYWDLIGNSGNFVESTPLIWSGEAGSPFWSFLRFSDWFFARIGRNHSIALDRLGESIFRYLTGELGLDAAHVARILWADWQRGGHHHKPAFLQDHISDSEVKIARARLVGPKRQARHLTP